MEKQATNWSSCLSGGDECHHPLVDWVLLLHIKGMQQDWTEEIPICDIVHSFHWKMKEGKPARLQQSLKEALKCSYDKYNCNFRFFVVIWLYIFSFLLPCLYH